MTVCSRTMSWAVGSTWPAAGGAAPRSRRPLSTPVGEVALAAGDERDRAVAPGRRRRGRRRGTARRPRGRRRRSGRVMRRTLDGRAAPVVGGRGRGMSDDANPTPDPALKGAGLSATGTTADQMSPGRRRPRHDVRLAQRHRRRRARGGGGRRGRRGGPDRGGRRRGRLPRSADVQRLTDRDPVVPPETLVAGLVPPPHFAQARFDTYRPDPAHPTQARALMVLRDFSTTLEPRKGLFGRRKAPDGPSRRVPRRRLRRRQDAPARLALARRSRAAGVQHLRRADPPRRGARLRQRRSRR